LNHCPPGTVFLASVSGGADSTAMLAALAALKERARPEAAINLRCIHVEHGIRPAAESRGDAEFVRSLCKKLHVPCRIISIKPGAIAAAAKKRGIGIEAAARLYRRRAWLHELRRIGAVPAAILVAHTADDMLETALMRILRGVGPSGLAAMPARRGHILRPLLTLSRSDVIRYLTEKNISWREDATNTDTQFLRNRIRHCLIPQLSEHFPQWRGGIAAMAETQSLAADFIRDEAINRVKWENNNPQSPVPSPQSLYTDASSFFAQAPIIREEALFQGINLLGCSGNIKRKNIRKFSQGTINAIDLGPIRLRKDSQQITLSLVPSHFSFLISHSSETGFSRLIKAPGSYTLNRLGIKISECPANLNDGDAFLAVLPLVLRPCYTDDAIRRQNRKITPRDLQCSGRVFAAVDRLGVAAFIGFDGLLQCRDKATLSAAEQYYVVHIENRSSNVK